MVALSSAVTAGGHAVAGVALKGIGSASVSGQASVSGSAYVSPHLPGAAVTGSSSVVANFSDSPRLPSGLVSAKATVLAAMSATPRLPGVAVTGQATIVANLIVPIFLTAGLVQGEADIPPVKITVVRHRTLLMLVTVGLAVDSSWEGSLSATASQQVRQISDDDDALAKQPAMFV